MRLFSRANLIAIVAFTTAVGCASKPPPPQHAPDEEAFVLDGKDRNAASASNENPSKNKNGAASPGDLDDTMTGNRGASHDIGSGAGSAPDHFGDARLGDSFMSLKAQGHSSIGQDGHSSITSDDSTYHGAPLDSLRYSFVERSLLDVRFASHGAPNCQKILTGLMREYGTSEAADQPYTTDRKEYFWRSATSSLDFQILPDSTCTGSLVDTTRTRWAH